MTYISNHKETVRTEIGEFMVEQRNVGFVENDGRWIVSQLPELYWSPIGVLHQRRPGLFLGVFDSREAVSEAIASAEVQPEHNRAVGC